MEPFKAHTFYNIGKAIESIARGFGTDWLVGSGFTVKPIPDPNLDQPMSDSDTGRLQMILDSIRTECANIKLERSTQYIDHIISKLQSSHRLTYRESGFLLRELDKHIRWDMAKEMFMYISRERAHYYHNHSLLSTNAMNNFPSSGEEIVLAGDCYAVGCWTASVMHSMRSLEKPIHAVADSIGGINLPKAIEVSQWGEIHREIDNKVRALRQTPLTPARDEEIAFYSSLNLEFGYFNDIWRRFVAHSRKSYDAPQAESAMQHVIAFIDGAANRLNETT